jgi:hypothetical protein
VSWGGSQSRLVLCLKPVGLGHSIAILLQATQEDIDALITQHKERN